MTRYRATLSYDGTQYCGFQRQLNARTIQAQVEEALTQVLGVPTQIVGAGRTDTGVHATGQVIAFDADWAHDPHTLLKVVNLALPNDIALRDIAQHAGFQPRYHALSRRYQYDVLVSATRQPLLARYTWQMPHELDLTAMNNAAQLLIGKHDFATFGQPPKGDNTVREVFVAGWSHSLSQEASMDSFQRYSFHIEATAFLHHMVRRIVGMLVQVGQGRQSVEQFQQAFQQANLKFAGKPAPPQGLVLVAVKYPPPDQNSNIGMETGGFIPSEVEDEG
jgi:tRNA pseudouridine38-40 synthase